MRNSSLIFVAGGALYALLATFIAGYTSVNIALGINQMGINLPLREPINLALVILFFAVWCRFSGSKPINNIGNGNAKSVLIGAIVAILILVISWGVLAALSQIEFIKAQPKEPVFSIIAAAIIPLILIFIHGLAEQYLIQRVAQSITISRFGHINSILIGAAVFAGLQAMQGYKGLGFILSSINLGLLLAILAQKYGLLAAASLHGFWTWAETSLLGHFTQAHFANNFLAGGGTDSYGSLAFALVCLFAALGLYFGLGLFKPLDYKLNNDKIEH